MTRLSSLSLWRRNALTPRVVPTEICRRFSPLLTCRKRILMTWLITRAPLLALVFIWSILGRVPRNIRRLRARFRRMRRVNFLFRLICIVPCRITTRVGKLPLIRLCLILRIGRLLLRLRSLVTLGALVGTTLSLTSRIFIPCLLFTVARLVIARFGRNIGVGMRMTLTPWLIIMLRTSFVVIRLILLKMILRILRRRLILIVRFRKVRGSTLTFTTLRLTRRMVVFTLVNLLFPRRMTVILRKVLVFTLRDVLLMRRTLLLTIFAIWMVVFRALSRRLRICPRYGMIGCLMPVPWTGIALRFANLLSTIRKRVLVFPLFRRRVIRL